jgi:antitoxin component YwqK of YwqJK toxin-antitoxin module
MKYILFILLFGLNPCHSQETFTNSHDDIYVENGVFYKYANHQPFTGTIEFIKKNGVIVTKETYKDGYLTNEYRYYNKSSRGKIYQETVYYEEKINSVHSKFKPKKIISYHPDGEIYCIKHFDLAGDKILEEEFENAKLVYSCEFRNGKKNGKEFCITRKECGNEIITYSNGKKVQ